MFILRTLLVCGLFLQVQVTVEGQERTTAPEKSPDATPTQPAFPLVVRIDDKALDPLREKDIRHQGPVERVILGTQAVGTCFTTGGINVKIVPREEEASIIIRFRGQTRTKTTGYNGPAIIYSHTDTEFECARQVVFQPRIGLVAGEPTIDARTALVYDGFDANRRLGKRLISRVARQRAEEQHEEARAIAHQENTKGVCLAFEKKLDAQLASINRQLDIARYVNALFGPTSQPRLVTGSCSDCILVGFGNEQSSQRLVDLLPAREKTSPIEIWVHSSLLGERFANVAAVAEKFEDHVLPSAAQLQILQVILGPSPAAETSLKVNFEKGWVVLGLPSDQHTPLTATLGMWNRAE